MNLSQLRELKDGDKIVCKHLPAFTYGKIYIVTGASVRAMVDDDNGAGRFLADIEYLFEKAIDNAT